MNEHNLTPAKPGEIRNPYGRPKGSKNRATIARQVLEMDCAIPEEVRNALINLFPDLPPSIGVEHLATLIQAGKMILRGDTKPYEKLLDSAYGRAAQKIELEPEEVEFGELTPEEEKALKALNEASLKAQEERTKTPPRPT